MSAQLTRIEKLFLEDVTRASLAKLSDDDLQAVWGRAQTWFNELGDQDTSDIEAKARMIAGEMRKRDMEPTDSALTQAIAKQQDERSQRNLTEAETRAQALFSKEAASYIPDPTTDDMLCGACRFFKAEGACDVVEGQIAASAHCDLWLPKAAVSKEETKTESDESTTNRTEPDTTNNGQFDSTLGKVSICVPSSGPKGALIAFVGGSPSKMQKARREPFTGPQGVTLRDMYLTPLGLERGQVFLTNVVPDLLQNEDGSVREPTDKEAAAWGDWIAKEIKDARPAIVVALGQKAKKALGKAADFVLPHPTVAERFPRFAEETKRKLRQIKRRIETLDKQAQSVDKSKNATAPMPRPEQSPTDDRGGERETLTPIVKVDPIKRIVYGVVLSPYGDNGPQEDAHNDWNPPASIEESAHAYMDGPKVIGFQHRQKADAKVVETWVEQYPTKEDYQQAMQNQDHRVWVRPFGTDVIRSGDWALGVKLGAKEWKAFEAGEINAFSPAGIGVRTPISRGQMPGVKFIELIQKPTR